MPTKDLFKKAFFVISFFEFRNALIHSPLILAFRKNLSFALGIEANNKKALKTISSKVAIKRVHSSFTIKVVSFKIARGLRIFCLLLSQKTYKNHSIWSHWLYGSFRHAAFLMSEQCDQIWLYIGLWATFKSF